MTISKKTGAWMLVAFVLVGLVTAASLWSFNQTDEAASARRQTRLLINRGEDLLSALKDAETGQRGFLLTGNETFLEPYLAVRDTIHLQLADLRQSAQLEATHQHLDAVAPLVTAKLADLAQVIALYRNNQIAQAVAQVSHGEGKRLMDAIRSEMKDFNQLLEVTAAQHDDEFRTNMRYLLGVIVAASLSMLLAAIAFATLAYRENQQRLKKLLYQETQRSLEIQQQTNLQLQHANLTLQISEEKLAVTLNSIGDGVIATDAQGLVTLLNPLAEQLTGWTQAQASGQKIEDVFHIIHQDTRQAGPGHGAGPGQPHGAGGPRRQRAPDCRQLRPDTRP
ncbi:MAG: signal transduction histidine kinase [Comamonadaceae bacterium]|nr:MAG: signal transduction histidine kinase [Comamonadaceae bacterium]